MRVFYVTLNTSDEARDLSRALLERRLAVCCNWFPIACAYRSEAKVVEEVETVLLVKTQAGYREHIEELVRQLVPYTNCVLEIRPESVNARFGAWLDTEVPATVPRLSSALEAFDDEWDED